ncbi:hypothetical protein CDL12_08630 [Handroanthus impetiginosus]|uniref:AP2/ERF domain-containing protein n=1 Tax=Handroanthus impetiginosus TaxID=429701 RepID=A0A2G9HMD4_9LAMI|nr:hypothetical protein CDL12_08630 [Handroanthus impetiginosus]
MQNLTKEEYLASLRRHHHNGRWEARIGRVFGNKYLYLGTYGTQEEAAQAYDIAAIEYRGTNAVTNFDLSTYIRSLRPGQNSAGCRNLTSSENDSNYMNLNKEPSSYFALTNPAISQKHEIIERKMPLSPCKKATSTTALGLLLRSSLFKELVEKTTTTAAEENDEKPRTCSGQEDHEFVFYGGNDHEKNASQLYNQTGQSFWNGMQYEG